MNQIRDLRAQLQELRKRLDQKSKAIVAAAEELEKKMAPVEEEIIQVKARSPQDPLNFPIKLNNKLTALAAVVESADTAPTQQSYELFQALSQQLDRQLARWEEIRARDVAAFNDLVRKEGVPAVILK